METKPNAEKFSVNQNVHSSEVELVESHIQGLDLRTRRQSRNELADSQSSHSHVIQQQQSRLTMNQDENPISREASGQVTNSRRYLPHGGRYSVGQDMLRLSFSPSQSSLREFQNSQQQRLQQLGRDQSMARNSQSGVNCIEACQSQSSMRLMPNELTAFQNSRSQNQQPLKTKEFGIQSSHLQNRARSNYDKCRLLSQQLQQHRQKESTAALLPWLNQASNPLPESSGKFFVMNRNQIEIPLATINYSDLKELRCPYANRSEIVNILLHGPLNWTNNLLNTLKRGPPFDFSPPMMLAHHTTITRCGVVMSVSVWQTDDLTKSTDIFKSYCKSAKSTVVLVNSFVEKIELLLFIGSLIEQIRRDINHSVPIVLVGCKMGTGIHSNLLDIALRLKLVKSVGFQTKAQLDLSAFLDCSVDSISDVDNVFFTAIDVSQQIMP